MAEGRLDPVVTGCFLSLVRSGLHAVPVTSGELEGLRGLPERSWERLVTLAREQTVTGLIQSAVELLPEDLAVPQEVELSLLAESVRIERRSASVRSIAGGLVRTLEDAGLHPVLLKGPAVAAFYPAPDRRISGDVDIYLPENEFRDGAALLGAGEPAPDGSLHCTVDGVDIDLHRRYYDLPDSARLPAAGSAEGVLLMLSAHIFKHACGAGVGLRQCCDYAMARLALNRTVDAMDSVYAAAGLSRWSRLLDSFSDAYLGRPGAFDAPGHGAARLLALVLKGGNFGTAGSSRAAALGRSAFLRKGDTFLRILGHLPFSLRYAPRPALFNLGLLLRGNM